METESNCDRNDKKDNVPNLFAILLKTKIGIEPKGTLFLVVDFL